MQIYESGNTVLAAAIRTFVDAIDGIDAPHMPEAAVRQAIRDLATIERNTRERASAPERPLMPLVRESRAYLPACHLSTDYREPLTEGDLAVIKDRAE